jgi:hypothetical protein
MPNVTLRSLPTSAFKKQPQQKFKKKTATGYHLTKSAAVFQKYEKSGKKGYLHYFEKHGSGLTKRAYGVAGKGKGKGRGWHGDSAGHAAARRKGGKGAAGGVKSTYSKIGVRLGIPKKYYTRERMRERTKV